MRIELSYQTQGLPAPYAFSVFCSIVMRKNDLELDFKLEYLDRENVSREEILAEGFSEDDDYSWNGKLGKNWCIAIESLLDVPLLDLPKDDFYVHLATAEQEGFPDLPGDVLIQELIQAVFETSGKETPLTFFVFLKKKQHRLSWEFASRTSYIDEKELKWEDSLDLMQALYGSEFDDNNVTKKAIERSISFDAVNWIEFKVNSFWDCLIQLQK